MKRRWLGLAVLAALVVTAGCMSMFSDIPDEQLCEDQSYDWNTSANATYTLTADANYKAVYNVSGADELELYRDTGLGNERPVEIRSVEFLAADGTEYDCEDIEVETTRSETVVTLPAEEGKFAYTASSTPKRFSVPVLVEGSHEVVLPEGRETRNPIFGSVRPADNEVTEEDDRLHVRWDEVEGDTVLVQYYLQRDLTLFFGLAVVAGLAAVAGILYYYRLVQRLRERRQEAGLDMDVDDDEFGDEPPPGME